MTAVVLTVSLLLSIQVGYVQGCPADDTHDVELLQKHVSFHARVVTRKGGGSIGKVRNVYHSLDENVSWPEALAPRQVQFDASRLCVPPAVGGCHLLEDEKFIQQVQDGREAVAAKGLVMAGLLRDDGDPTAELLGALHQVGSAFARHHLIIIENDSKDSTRKNMDKECLSDHAWCFEVNLPFLGPKKQDQGVAKRIEHLTWLRQQLLSQVRRFVSGSTESWDFVLMFDGDLFSDGNAGFDPTSTLSLFGFRGTSGKTVADAPPDVVCANSIQRGWHGPGRYRDSFALRVLSFDEVRLPDTEYFWYEDNKLVPLQSCYSGLALYALPGLVKSPCGYEYVDERTCEHVVFHECLARNRLGNVALYPPWTVRFNESAVHPQACADLSLAASRQRITGCW
mmetsp:Transcript_97657/g.172999  ORF Transcript_97657/g.172999 Transcript_97657/m.172999 type:complete len:397 (-) Transcript_97657:140-1330(-)